ncbi:MAG: hypothetical protein ACI9T8_000430 [Candidatus Saccharimonadales bacterium]|jgi:hypothetical protein
MRTMSRHYEYEPKPDLEMSEDVRQHVDTLADNLAMKEFLKPLDASIAIIEGSALRKN